jgi:hypothetical protein
MKGYYEFINEATLGFDKKGVNYQLSRPGREKAHKFSDSVDLESFNIKFENTDEIPNDSDDVLEIRASSFRKLKYSSFKNINKLEDSDIMFYKVISDDINIKWAVAREGQRTGVLKQLDRKGASKRGDYFRETAFIIKFAKIAWERTGVRLKIYSNRGEIEMDYKIDNKNQRVAEMSRQNSVEFRDAFYDFENKSPIKVIRSMDEHCNKLINYLGNKISDIKYIVKNNSNLLINLMAINFMRDESITKSKLSIESGFDFKIPSKANISKWNPSDIWIVFDDTLFKNESAYKKREIENIWDLNEFLYNSLMDKTGLIGVSLKMSRGKSELVKITKDTKFINRYKDFDISNNKKTAGIDFEYKNKEGDRWYKGAGIDCRTFDTSNSSSISLEVKGKKGAGYVSGKAGSIINHLLPDDIYRIKDILRREKSKDTIRMVLNIDFDKMGDSNYKPVYLPKDEKLKQVFLNDLRGDGVKNSAENSRLQTVVFLDWILSLSDKPKGEEMSERDSVITTIIRYAKSESLWSAPHIVLK